jgi:hypothetical protein
MLFLYIYIYIYKSQQDAHVTELILSGNCPPFFGHHQHPSSGAQNKINLYLPSLMMKVPNHLYVLCDTYTCHT